MRNLLSSPPRRRGWPRLAAAALLLIATIADSRADTAPDPVAIKEILEHTVSGYAQPVSAAFAQQAKELATQTAATCCGGSAPLEGLRSTFRDLAAGWGRLSVARFGPLVADARLEKLAFWPDDRGAVRRQTLQLAAALPAGDAEAIAWLGKQSAAAQGLPAFDFLAFAPDVERNCRMAVAVAGNIARLAEEVADGFKDDAHLALLTPGPDNPSYPNAGEALAEVFRAMSTQAEVVRTIMILSPSAAPRTRRSRRTCSCDRRRRRRYTWRGRSTASITCSLPWPSTRRPPAVPLTSVSMPRGGSCRRRGKWWRRCRRIWPGRSPIRPCAAS